MGKHRKATDALQSFCARANAQVERPPFQPKDWVVWKGRQLKIGIVLDLFKIDGEWHMNVAIHDKWGIRQHEENAVECSECRAIYVPRIPVSAESLQYKA